ncbi:MAG: hypothetical protein Unbinned92contig1004_39 [Prokaryotic dsDNA virus sp.]|nr:MAG: hypothetical protein Unbinned92contig1004_39 [Prokaryotic dsDNA virus sp.]|tara:strand:+ start:1041 stop:1226 length:186 start_codon:yes stop_codon:yes gene_type:complete
MIGMILTEVSAWYIDHIWEILLALLAFLKVMGNLIPSDKPREVFAILDKIVNALVPDNIKK